MTVYLDHAATTPMRSVAVDAMLPFFTERFANPSGSHRFARDARKAIDEARDVLAERVMVAFAEVGLAATPQLHTVMRAWISFAEETIVEATQRPEVFSAPELVDLLERSALAVASVTSDTAASVIATLRAFAS